VQVQKYTILPITRAGFSRVTATICLERNAIACVEKSVLVDVLPGPEVVSEIVLPTSTMMAGADLPVGMKIQDVFGNQLLKSIGTYKILSTPAQGQFVPGSGAESAEIQDF
jgi:hypothetical protein